MVRKYGPLNNEFNIVDDEFSIFFQAAAIHRGNR